MNRKDSLWLLKTSSGKIRGPLSTNAILQIISDGALTGDEEIALVPDGEWLPISTEPDFYEKLLEAMEAEAQASESQINRKAAGGARSNDKHFAATVIKPPTPGKQDDTEQTRSIVIPLKPKIDEVSQSSNPFAKTPPPTNSTTREKKDTHSEPVLELHTASQVRNHKPLQIGLILIVIAVFAYLFLEEEAESPQSRVSFLLPAPGKVQLSENEAKVVLQKALRLMERSNGDDLIQAQNIIASVVEGSSNNLEARGLLCFLYKEIWPYTAMDSGQLKIAQMFTQQTRSLNLVSPYGNYCEAVNLFLNDRTRETKGVLDGILETDPRFSMLPVVYLFKGEVLQQEQDWATSLAFTEKASELWPEWVLPRVVIGRTQYLKGNRAEAYKAFQNALIRGPTHVESLLYTAVILFSDYKRNDEAKQIFDRQLGPFKENLDRLYVPKTIKAEALYSYAQILLQLGQSDAAIPFARAALKIYPSVGRYRDLIARLGEAESISEKDRGSELLALGDQYAKKGDCLTAQAEYKSVFEADPRNSMAAVKAAQCLWKLNQGHEALNWLNKATQADPRNILAYTLKADYLSKRYDFESAIRAINTAQSLDANNHDLLKAMGIVERRRKNLPAAITYLGKA
ncbi:MAG TPA: tetratricopeptide repeat protein, partial [Pseudobdellovibrionaceae bacterium]|nr:tetratricopeptide repeat protein [Pseudobdellovibrionaceae bacterium]